MENITYTQDNKRLVEAKIFGFVEHKSLKIALKLIVGIGAAAFSLAMVLTTFPDLELGLVSALLWFLVFGGLVSFWILNLGSFLRAQEFKTTLNERTRDVGISSDWGATILLSRINYPAVDLGKLIKYLTEAPEVQFILSELNPDENFWGYVRAGMGVPNYFNKVLSESVSRAIIHRSPLVSRADIFWGVIAASENYEKILSVLEVEESDISNIFFLESKLFTGAKYPKTMTEKLKSLSSGIGQSWDAGYTNYLDHFSRNILAGPDEGFSVEGRRAIEEEVENVLTKGSKNNIILTGPVGVGKTTLVKELVSRIAWNRSLPTLAYQRVVELDLGAIISRSSDRAELENVIVSVFNDAVTAGNVILYIQNIQDIFSGATKEGTIDASEIILPYLRNSSLRIIGTTTEKGYETNIQPKSELSSSFTHIKVEPTEKSETLRVLAEVSVYKGKEYGVSVSYGALQEMYLLTEKYVTEKEFPGKAIDMLENVCSAARNKGLKVLDKNAVAQVAEKQLNVKVATTSIDEKNILLNLEETMHKRVVGQFAAVKAVADAMRRARTDIKNGKRPVGTFLFLGPTGVGKTELAKTLAAAYFGDESKMIRMDMNEFQDREAISRFIGKKASGSEELEGGEFVKQVRANPSSLILLDEIEKANPNILDLLLQAIDEGYLMDGMGEKVVLSGTIIIATSNAGGNTIRKMMEVSADYQAVRVRVLDEVQTSGIFKAEFLNRFDGVIMFTPLSATEILKTAELMFAGIQADFKSKGYDIELAPGVLEKLAQEGYVPEMGARPMRRVFQDRLENYLAKLMLEDKIKKGETLIVKVEDIY